MNASPDSANSGHGEDEHRPDPYAPSTPFNGLTWVGTDFNEARPDYPTDALRYALRDAAADILIIDLGSGTGILSRALRSFHGGGVLALEPSEEMRSCRRDDLIPQVGARAEGLPLRTGSVDAIFAGHAAHWFDPVVSAKEFQRVLKPGGRIVLLWNRLEHQSLQLKQLWVDLGRQQGPWTDDTEWRRFFEKSGEADVEVLPEFRFDRRVSTASLRSLVRSGSQFAEATEGERQRIDRLTEQAIVGESTLHLRYVTIGMIVKPR